MEGGAACGGRVGSGTDPVATDILSIGPPCLKGQNSAPGTFSTTEHYSQILNELRI